MAKKNSPLTFRDIVLGADADVIKQALEARVQIDQLIEERDRAYERIAALETQVEDIMGESGLYPFPPPPMPIAGFDPKAEAVTRGSAPAKKGAAKSVAAGGEDSGNASSGAAAGAASSPSTTPAAGAHASAHGTGSAHAAD